MSHIQSLFPVQLSIVRKGGRWRARLRLRRNGAYVSVLVCRAVKKKYETHWIVAPIPRECKFPTLIARLRADNEDFEDFYLFPVINRKTRFEVTAHDPWLKQGKRLSSLGCFCETLEAVRLQPG
jgi:hypothetical protein